LQKDFFKPVREEDWKNRIWENEFLPTYLGLRYLPRCKRNWLTLNPIESLQLSNKPSQIKKEINGTEITKLRFQEKLFFRSLDTFTFFPLFEATHSYLQSADRWTALRDDGVKWGHNTCDVTRWVRKRQLAIVNRVCILSLYLHMYL
jgi:hypothetical protein